MIPHNSLLWSLGLKVFSQIGPLPHGTVMPRERSAIIIGGGIIGATGAYALAREGWRVRVIDALPDVGLGTSLGNGRQLSYSHTNALASPAIIWQIPRLVLGMDEAFRIRLRFDRHFMSWVLRFLAQCTGNRNRRNTLASTSSASSLGSMFDLNGGYGSSELAASNRGSPSLTSGIW